MKKKYTNSIFYEVFLTGKYIKKMGEQLFKKLNLEFTSEEFSTLDFLYENENICQRDLAVKMLINRANMGKILDGLEKKGYIKRTLDIKQNHPVKIVTLTNEGEKVYVDTVSKLKTFAENAASDITEQEKETVNFTLQKIRNGLRTVLEIDI